MCRNIRPLFNYEPPATDDEIHGAALQFVRKVSGFHKPSQVNTIPFDRAVADVAEAVHQLLDTLETSASPRNREVDAARARANAAKRFG